jgi:2-hydroxycyclohexanecarboxyl-CoA dehydrogenase
MMFVEFPETVAVVTGAGGGIGQAITMALADRGATVAALDLDPAGVPQANTVHAYKVDITDEDSVRAVIADVVADLGTPTVLVNNAGVAGRVGMPFTRLGASDWDLAWQVNVVGLFNVSAAVTPHMLVAAPDRRRRGAIVNIASVSGRTGFPTSPPYSASKAAVINFTQAMARDLAKDGIRVNAVCPGMVFTPFYRAQRLAAAEADPSLLDVTDEEYFARKAASLIPLGEGQQPVDIANAVCFLASDAARSITGQSLNVDGGLVMS